MKKNERTLQMMKNYILLHNAGMTPGEIAKKFDLSTWTVYNALQEIADNAGVTRESLLERPHSEHQPFERISEPVKPIDIKAFSEKFQNALGFMSEFKEMVDMAIEDAEKFKESL
jgi:transcriptional antiterminator